MLKSTKTILWLMAIFLNDLVASALQVAGAIINPSRRLQPAIVAVPLDVKKDASISALANMVTLTPGTTSIHVSDDRSTLYVHSLDCTDKAALIASIKDRFETRLKELEA